MLSQIFDKKKTQSIIDIMPDSMVVWKIVTDWGFLKVNASARKRGMTENHWHPAFSFAEKRSIWFPFKSGYNENNIWGFHCFVTKNETQQYKKYFKGRDQIGYWNMVSAKIEKKDIIKIGLDKGSSLTILTSCIIMPTYPNTDITKEIAEDCNLIESCKSSIELMSDNLGLIDVEK